MLRLPATPASLLREVIEPALARLPATMDSTRSRCLLTAIAIQESELKVRRQVTNTGFGPARSPWQFEQGGVRGLLTHPSTDDLAALMCREAKVHCESRNVHLALEGNDLLACQFARLLLFTDPKPLPNARLDNEAEAFAYYLRNWRPGAAKTAVGRAECAKRFRNAWRMAVEATA